MGGGKTEWDTDFLPSPPLWKVFVVPQTKGREAVKKKNTVEIVTHHPLVGGSGGATSSVISHLNISVC